MKQNIRHYKAVIIFLIKLSILFAYHPNHNQNVDNDFREVTNPAISVLNINNMSYWIYKDGSGTTSGSPNQVQADYPASSGGLIYVDGMLWGVESEAYQESQPIRVGGSTYYRGLKAGRVIYDIDGNVLGSDDPENHHVWRVRSNWDTADLTSDAANFYAVSDENVTGWQIQNIYDQYEYDWMNWPSAWGAPFDDVDGNGSYDPLIDIPGYPGADQTLWTIANDIPTILDNDGNYIGTMETSFNLYGSEPIGVELRITMWAYDIDHEKALGNSVFKRAQLTYIGLENTSPYINPDVLNKVYFTNWSDTDLGQYTDDFVGCDTALSLGYVYNGFETDDIYNEVFDMVPPAGGYDFLKSPVDEDGVELGMTAFTYFGANSSIADPDLSSYSGSLQFFNLMEGFLPRPEYPEQVAWTDPTTGESTNYAISGDPISGDGWIDGLELPPGDRRIVMSSGPFAMNKGDTQDIVVALIGAQGMSRLESVRNLKMDDELVQIAYSTNYNLLDYTLRSDPSDNDGVYDVEVSVEVSSLVSSVSVSMNNGLGDPFTFSLDQDNNFLFLEEIAESNVPYSLSLILYLSNGDIYVVEELNQKIVVWDPINISEYDVLYDNLTDDGVLNAGDLAHISLTIENTSGDPIDNLTATIYDVTGAVDSFDDRYLHFGSIEPMNNSSSSNELNESAYVRIKVAEDAEENDIVTLWLRFFDSLGNIWEEDYQISIYGNELVSDLIDLEHVTGSADGNFVYRIVRPQDVTGDEYELSFSVYEPDLITRSTGKTMDCSGSYINGKAVSSVDGTIDLEIQFNMECPGGAWVDGIQFTFPTGFSSLVNNHSIIGPGNICSYGSDSGQNCDNLDGTWTGDVLLFGNNIRSSFGAFESSNVFSINYTPSQGNGEFTPVSVEYIIYDDGYDGNIVDADGEYTFDELWAYSEGTILMNIVNNNTGELILSTDIYPNSDGSNIDILDGFKLFKGNVIYGAAEDVNDIYYNSDSYSYYEIDSYFANTWSLSARATDTWGAGITSASILGRDIQIRFTGEFVENPITTDAGIIYYPAQDEGGSWAWIDGSRLSDLSEHPDPNNPLTGDPFRIKIPFEVWDMEAEGGPTQIDITIYDRKQTYESGNTVYSFNPYDRMYTHFIHLPYQEDGQYGTAQGNIWGSEGNGFSTIENNLTWNVVWWNTEFTQNDILTFNYLTPISIEDSYVFTPTSDFSGRDDDIVPLNYYLAQNYPNPFNPKTKIKYSIPKDGLVQLMIYDILGREIFRIVDTQIKAGNHISIWNGKNVNGENAGAGMYFYKLKSRDYTETKKMILLK